MSRFKYAGRARDNDFYKFDNPFFANPEPLRRMAERDRKKRDMARSKARSNKRVSSFDY